MTPVEFNGFDVRDVRKLPFSVFPRAAATAAAASCCCRSGEIAVVVVLLAATTSLLPPTILDFEVVTAVYVVLGRDDGVDDVGVVAELADAVDGILFCENPGSCDCCKLLLIGAADCVFEGAGRLAGRPTTGGAVADGN